MSNPHRTEAEANACTSAHCLATHGKTEPRRRLDYASPAAAAEIVETTTRKCGRCNGEGVIAAFAHVAGGRCLKCRGAGRVEVYTAAGKAAAADREARHAALAAAARDADYALRPSKRHHARDLAALEADDPIAYETALAAVVL